MSVDLNGEAPATHRGSLYLLGYIQPLLSSLSDAHEFDVDTSIQYFAPLAIPVARDTDTGGTIVQESDLRAFVNNAEWNMRKLTVQRLPAGVG